MLNENSFFYCGSKSVLKILTKQEGNIQLTTVGFQNSCCLLWKHIFTSKCNTSKHLSIHTRNKTALPQKTGWLSQSQTTLSSRISHWLLREMFPMIFPRLQLQIAKIARVCRYQSSRIDKGGTEWLILKWWILKSSWVDQVIPKWWNNTSTKMAEWLSLFHHDVIFFCSCISFRGIWAV